MTSEAKDNHHHILSICEENNWFKRGKENFFFIKQLSVPLITVEGNWVVQSPLKLSLKPGGHGVIWKLMQENGAFDFLFEKKRKFGLIRQINNPMAGLDYGLLALLGIGTEKKKAFGFAACPRIVKSAEGVDILRERKTPKGYYYGISNIEYTDFAKWGIEDAPQKNSNFSKYPSNTNILFADLKVIQKSIEDKPLIAMIINLKSKVPSLDGKKEVLAGRLEMMMQNIADNLMDFRKTKITKEEQKKLQTFLTFNQRLKTISVTKKAYIQNKPIFETPRGCFYDLLYNYHDLLTNYCKMELPLMPTEEEFVNQGPSFIVQMQSALGPLYSIISKKIIGGKMSYNSELQLEIADLYLENLKLNGSLLIYSDLVNNDGNYNLSKCKLINIQIQNLGIDRKANNVFWQNKISRKESLKIILHKNSQIQAENITFKGNFLLEVPPNHKMTVLQEKIKIKYKLEKLYS
ncbi:MAG: UTP--glucose-1-phosphate uridylyltransferase [Chlamydiae bacterium]|nr:UTP--glucose-1-phosphate uridylyltransferase [Chlamydiota bacterium]